MFQQAKVLFEQWTASTPLPDCSALGSPANRSSLLRVNDMMHFALGQQGIWQYANGRLIEMCPWNRHGTNFDTASCRSRANYATTTYTRVERFYSRRD